MSLNTFAPNTKISSSEVNQNFQNFSDHARNFTMKFGFGGVLEVQNGNDYIALPDNAVVERVDLILPDGSEPVGADVIVDIEYSDDGGATWTTIFTTPANRPSILDGERTGNTTSVDVPNAVALTRYYRAVIDQVGSTTAGSDLSIMVRGKYTLD